MHPFLFEIYGFKVYTYGMAMVTAFFVCVLLTFKYRQKDVLTSQDIYNLSLLAIAALLFATKLKEMLVHRDFSLQALKNLSKFWEPGSFAFWPSFLLATALVFSYCQWHKISILKVMDDLLPIAILGVAIQRTGGCFMAGCCYGKPTLLPWGITFPQMSSAGLNYPGTTLHPTQLYYGITAAMIFFFLVWYKKRNNKVGIISALGFIMLGFSYFVITFLRGDIPAEQYSLFLSFSQYLSLVLFAAGCVIYIIKKNSLEEA